MELEWWMQSPSPMTLFVFAVYGIYGAHRLESRTKRDWIGNFAASTLLVGMVILPHDSAWQILQWLKWGHLHPTEYVMVIGVLLRNFVVFLLCWHSSWQLASNTGILKLRYVGFVIIPILVIIVKFLIAPSPAWTDWTYGIRFMENPPWLFAYLAGLPDKVTLGLVYVGLWRDNFVVTS